MTDPWPPEAIAELTRYHALGWSAGRTGLAMNKSRCAIIGKKKRLGLLSSGHPQVYFAHTGGRKAKPAIVSKPLPKPIIPTEAPESKGLTMEALGHDHCRYPVEELSRGSYLFCGAAAIRESPYCAFHDSRCRVKATGKYK